MEADDAEGSRAYTPSESPKSAGHTPTSSATSGAGSPVESEPWSPSSPPRSVRRAPIDVLFCVFPYMKRSVLQLILQGCHGDVVQAIEQVLNNHYADTSLLYSSAPPLPPSPYALSARPNYSNPSADDAKSAFSPLAMGPNPLSYGYTSASGRGLAFALPYPPALLPNLATLSYSYNAMAAAAAVSMESHKADVSVDDAQSHLYTYATPTAEKIN